MYSNQGSNIDSLVHRVIDSLQAVNRQLSAISKRLRRAGDCFPLTAES
jgi:hypothetical protein